MTSFIRMLMRNVFVNVFKSDAVIWWVAIFRTSSSMFDKLLYLSESGSFAMSCSRRHDLCEAVGNLLTVTMNLQGTLSRFHCQGLHKADLRVHVRRLAPLRFTNPRAAELSIHSTIIQVSICTLCSIGLSLRYLRKLHQPAPSAGIHQNSDKPCSASWRTHARDTTCFQQNT